jgi:hypothetical protein
MVPASRTVSKTMNSLMFVIEGRLIYFFLNGINEERSSARSSCQLFSWFLRPLCFP